MKIVVHGTKGGYHIFTPERIPGLIDARPDFNKVAAIGQQAYAINFSDNNIIFSKYIIIRDVIGEKRMGNIAFSIIISNNKKLSGEHVKALVDQLADEYYSKYIERDNLDNVREDWHFLEVLTEKYDALLRTAPEEEGPIPQGTQEAAFVYYTTEDELQRYFDAPYQDEYKSLRQVFFVKSELEGKAENPLNALRHDASNNLTGKIDLENPTYKLLFKEVARGGVKIEVKVKGLSRSNKDRIRKKSEIEIVYSKLHYNETRVKGKWMDLVPEFITVDHGERTFSINELGLSPIAKTVTFEVREGKKNQPGSADITCESTSTGEKKTVIDNKVTFEAKEIKEKWIARASIGKLSGSTEFTPELQHANVVVLLETRKILEFNVKDDDGIVFGYKIEVEGKDSGVNKTSVEFIGDAEVDNTWTITITHPHYEKQTFSYYPATGQNLRYVALQKEQKTGGGSTTKKLYVVDAGKHGSLRGGDDNTTTNDPDGADVKGYVVPNKGYVFTKFELSDKKLIACYQRKAPFYKNPKVLTVIGVIAILVFAYINFKTKNSEKTGSSGSVRDSSGQAQTASTPPAKNIAEEITQYCEGNVLREEVLKNYKTIYCAQGKPDYCPKIEEALAIRLAINQGEIDELENKLKYPAQERLKSAISNIDDNYKEGVSKAMEQAKVSVMDLKQVSDFIDKVQDLLKIDISNLGSESDCDAQLQKIESWSLPDIAIANNIKKKINDKRERLKNPNRETHTNPTPPVTTTPNSNHNRPAPNFPSESSTGLKTAFWALVNSGNVVKKSYDNLFNKYNGNKSLAGEEADILIYLRTINNSTSFGKFKKIDQITRETANTLRAIDIN